MKIRRLCSTVSAFKWVAALMLPTVFLSTAQWCSGPLWRVAELRETLQKYGLNSQGEADLLNRCSAEGKTEALLWMLLAGASPDDACGAQGMSPMEAAAAAGQVRALQLLTCFGARYTEEQAMLAAIENNRPEVVAFLLKIGAAADVADRKSESFLSRAVRHGYNEIAAYLLSFGANPEREEQEKSAWMRAVQNNQAEMVRWMLWMGAEALRKQETLHTALVEAAQHGCCDVLRVLVEFGADVNGVGGEQQYSPLHAAASAGKTDSVQLLLEMGANDNVLTSSGKTALLLAAQGKHYRTVHLLREKRKVQTFAHSELLQRAVIGNQVEMVQQLLAAGADAGACAGDTGAPLLMLARTKEMKEVLLSYGADPFAADSTGASWPEMLASSTHATQQDMEYALSFGFDPDVLQKAVERILERLPQTGQVQIMLPLLMSDVNLDAVKMNILHGVALHAGAPEFAELLDFGYDVNSKNEEGLYVADVLPTDAIDKLELLMNRGFSENAKAEVLQRSLISADADRAAFMLNHGANPNARTAQGASLLSCVLESDASVSPIQTVECLRVLQEHGLSADLLTPTEKLACLCSSFPEQQDAAQIQALIEAGADVNAYALFGKTPLHLAVAGGGNREIVLELLKRGANPQNVPQLLASAVKQNDKELVKLLMMSDSCNVDGVSPETLLALLLQYRPDSEKIEALLEMDIDVNAITIDGASPLMHLVEKPENWGVVSSLVRHHANVHALYPDGRTLLMAACAVPNNTKMVEVLLAAGVDAMAWDTKMRSALNHYVCDDETRYVITNHLVQKKVHLSSIKWESQKSNTIEISISQQKLRVRDATGAVIFEARVSTGLCGVGYAPGSNKTPLGRFRIIGAYGKGAPWNMKFRCGMPTRLMKRGNGGYAAVLSRVLALDGLDSNNKNTRYRNIYLHGTNRVDLIGRPASHGCIRMHPKDIIKMFPLVPVGTRVKIEV